MGKEVEKLVDRLTEGLAADALWHSGKDINLDAVEDLLTEAADALQRVERERDAALNGCKAALPILMQLVRLPYNVETWGLNGRIKAVEAALNATAPAEARSVSLPTDPIDPFLTALEIVLRSDEEAPDGCRGGLADQIDHAGEPYQSATLASALRIIRARVFPTPPKAEADQ